MSRSNYRIYFHLVLSLALIPVIVFGNEIVKAFVMAYAVWLVLKKDAGMLPALTVITSYLSNSYAVYVAIIILSVLNYGMLKKHRVHLLFIALFLYLPYVIFHSLFEIFLLKVKAGLALNQFQLYFSLFAFFYGIIIFRNFNQQIMKVLTLTFGILYLSNVLTFLNPAFGNVRLNFYIIPFFTGFIIYFLNNKRKLSTLYILIGLVIFLSAVVFTESTFTIYLTSILSLIFTWLFYSGKNKSLYKLTGVTSFILMILLTMYAITNYDKNDYSVYKGMDMAEVSSAKSLSNRLKMKFFDDRAPIWAGVWNDIKIQRNWTPPSDVKAIESISRSGNTRIFEFHSHNTYLELIRTNGIIVGSLLTLIFIKIALLGRKIYSLKTTDPLFIIFISASISTMIIGSLTGIYVLLSTYALLGLSIVGISYAYYSKINHEHSFHKSS